MTDSDQMSDLEKLCRTGIPGYDPWAGSDGYHWDEDAAQRAIDFFPLALKHVKGPLAGKPFELAPWQRAIVGNLWGWRDDGGWRRYRECFIYVGKKNGKSAFVAGLLLLVLISDGEQGAELYSAASSRDQAGIIFQHASGMVRKNATLRSRLRVYGARGGSQTKSIVYEAENSSYKCLSADANTADGANVHFAAIDEVHRHKSPELARVLRMSTVARSQPLIVYTTTADYNRDSLCNTLLKMARAVRDNCGDPSKPGLDPTFLPCIWETLATDNWKDEAVWRKANPNLGVSVPLSALRRECKRAQESPTDLNDFLRLHLNQVTDADVAALPMHTWDKCPADFTREDMKGEKCWGGLDLSKTVDLTAFVLWFPESERCLAWFWIPDVTARDAENRDRVPYTTWVRQGWIELTPGDVVDYPFVRGRIEQICKDFDVVDIGFDRYGARQMVQELQDDAGLTMVEFIQGPLSYNDGCTTLERLVIGRTLGHGGNPVLRMCASNLMWRKDVNNNVAPDKRRSTGRIDGISALAMAIGRSIVTDGPGVSAYSTGGVRQL